MQFFRCDTSNGAVADNAITFRFKFNTNDGALTENALAIAKSIAQKSYAIKDEMQSQCCVERTSTHAKYRYGTSVTITVEFAGDKANGVVTFTYIYEC